MRVGLLIDWLDDEYQNVLFAGAQAAALKLDLDLTCFAGGNLDDGDPRLRQRNAVHHLARPECVDGLILACTLGNRIGPEGLAKFAERYQPLPLCCVGIKLEGIVSLTVDNEAGMREVMRHMTVACRRKRIAFIRGPESNEEAQLRYRVYCEILEEHGIPFDPALVTIGDFQRPSGAEAIAKLLDERSVHFDALVAASDFMALGALDELLRRGVRVPQDIAVAGFDDMEEARFARVPLTTVRQPVFELGYRAVYTVKSLLDHLPLQRVTRSATRLVIRRSCGYLSGVRPQAPSRRPLELQPRDPDLLFVGSERPAFVREGAQAAWPQPSSENLEAVERLTDVLHQALHGGFDELFVASVTTLAEQTGSERGRVVDLHRLVAVWRDHLSRLLTGNAIARALAERLLNAADTAISAVNERTQGQNRFRVQILVRLLRSTAEALFAALDLDQVLTTVVKTRASLGIPSCHVVLNDDDCPEGQVKLVLVSDETGFAKPGRMFPRDQLLPPESPRQDRRRTAIVQPLNALQHALGYVVLELGPNEGFVYEAFGEQLSSAIQACRMVTRLVEEARRREQAEKLRLTQELAIAANIQTGILPREFQIQGLEMSATMLPASQVGGDYYDVIPANYGCWIGIGDVAGHGLRAGLVMLMIQSMVSILARQVPEVSPVHALHLLNTALYENVRLRLQHDEHATFSLIRYTPNGRLVFAGAHEDFIVCRASTGRCELIRTPGPWIGGMSNLPSDVPESEAQLCDGDVLLLYSDGAVEARNADRRLYGVQRLCQELERVQQESVAEIRDRLMHSVVQWASVRDDDITLLVARYHMT